MIYTLLANRVKYSASSSAVFPPPTTAVTLSLKNAASQVAQYDTPLPVNSLSPGTLKRFNEAPVAAITARPSRKAPSVVFT